MTCSGSYIVFEMQVTFRAGTTLMEITDYLDRNGLALGVLPAILEQTIAGAISTGALKFYYMHATEY